MTNKFREEAEKICENYWTEENTESMVTLVEKALQAAYTKGKEEERVRIWWMLHRAERDFGLDPDEKLEVVMNKINEGAIEEGEG